MKLYEDFLNEKSIDTYIIDRKGNIIPGNEYRGTPADLIIELIGSDNPGKDAQELFDTLGKAGLIRKYSNISVKFQ